jgi:hypothetical protein
MTRRDGLRFARPTPEEPERARKGDGTFQADDPKTPGVNEAWEGGSKPAKKKPARKKPAKKKK